MVQRLMLFITWYALNSCSSPQHITIANDYHTIPFRTIGQKIPIIQATLNQKNAWFIVDTGASITLLNATEATYFGFSMHQYLRNDTEVSGFLDKLTISKTSLCTIEIGNLKIEHDVYQSLEMNALFITIGNNERMRIAGILGSDLLARYRMNVNYETRTLSYRVGSIQP